MTCINLHADVLMMHPELRKFVETLIVVHSYPLFHSWITSWSTSLHRNLSHFGSSGCLDNLVWLSLICLTTPDIYLIRPDIKDGVHDKLFG